MRYGARAWAFLTAANPASRRLPETANALRQAELEGELAARGLTFFRGEGAGEDPAWPPEPSVLVLGLPLPAALELAERFGQLAVVRGELGGTADLAYVPGVLRQMLDG